MVQVEVRVFDEFIEFVDPSWLTSVAETALAVEGADIEELTTVVIADDETVAELNAEHRGLNTTTDVLSFSNVHSGAYYGDDNRDSGEFEFVLPPGHQPEVGEVIISLQQAERQAREAGQTLENEIAALVAHGIFHLLGYDHEDESDAVIMQAIEVDAKEEMRRTGLVD
jgi:probable rRNA maturation factor